MSTEKMALMNFLQGSNLVSALKAEEIAGHFTLKELAKNEFHLKQGRVTGWSLSGDPIGLR